LRVPYALKPARVLRILAQNALLAVVLLGTLGVSAMVTMRVVLSSRDVAVPPLAGRTLREAETLVAARGLTHRIEGRRHDPGVPEGRVVAQEPPPGATLKTHRAVRLWLSLGPKHVSVPRVEGDSVRSARSALEQAGVPLARVVEVPDAAPEGTVLVQRPPPGERDLGPEGVSLLVSRGQRDLAYVMPDLIGRDARSVLAALERAGLKVTDVRYRSYPGVAPGIVLRQSPAAGERVSSRASLSLDISRPTS
jgi:beta-lactam-binding protein with PASTA domain